MKRIEQTSQFKKDIKRFRHQTEHLKALFEVVEKLAKGEKLPTACRLHKLHGNYVGYMECHVEGDLLLLWVEITADGEEIFASPDSVPTRKFSDFSIKNGDTHSLSLICSPRSLSSWVSSPPTSP